MKHRKYLHIIVTCFCALVFIVVLAMKTNAQGLLRDNPYITLSPDGNAFTTNADETDTEWYDKGHTVYFQKDINLRETVKGEHYYNYIRTGQVPVGKWSVEHVYGSCIHRRKFQINSYHGVIFRKEICGESYYSGWLAYCADCGQRVADCYVYMSEETARNLPDLDMSMAYYYRCPHCTHLEQGVPAQATELDRKYPNILIISVNPTATQASYSIAKNAYARPQTLITITAPTTEEAVQFIADATTTLRSEFEKAERSRSNTYNA